MKISSVCLLLVFLVVVACATTGPAPKMSFEEARDVVASYAHPIFWGPFVVIGASGVQ